MQGRHLCWPPYFFLGPAVAPHFFNSRTATAHTVQESGSQLQCHAVMGLQFTHVSSLPAEAGWESRERIVLLLFFSA